MAHDNGHGQPLAFKEGVPIIGQAFTIKNWFLTVMGVCNCGHPEPVLIAGQFGSGVGQCPACHRIWAIKDLRHDVARGRIEIDLGIVPTPGQPHQESTASDTP